MIGEGVTLSTYIDLLSNNSSSYSACYVNLQEKVCNHGVFQMGNAHFQLSEKWLENGAQPTEVVGKILKLAGVEK